MYLNMVVQAWIIGSITLLIVKQDEKTGIYRDALKKLSRYAELHDFDRGFHQRLKTAVKLNFESKDVTDQEILYHFPSAVRRKILRRLYVPSLLQTSLLRGVRQQFVDAFLTACSVEVFSPGEEILQLGSVSTDLYLLVSGMVQLIEVDNSLVRFKRIQDSGTSVADSDEQGDSTRDMSIGEFLNEISFFTECPQTDSVTTVGVCKTLMISRFAYKQLCSDYPGSCTMILQNLHGKLNEQVYEMNDNDSGRDEVPLGADGRSMTHSSEVRRVVQSAQARASLTSIQDMVRIRIDAQKDEHTTKFLFAASRGDVTTISRMCDHGLDPNSTDYDSRTALMVAAMKGNTDIVKKLLEDYTCNPNLVDIHGSSALYEATKNGCDETVQVLLRNGAKLCMSDGQAASKLCQTVFDGDTLTLRRLLRSKILVNAADYDKRTAAHIAAAEGNLTALRMLVEFGADLSLRDRWNNSVEDEARKINSQKILLYLQFLEDKIEKPVTQNRSNDSVV